ncbi:MAG: substrate-binding domain-containing protein [Acidimicrobiia bacterium]|nr:substrate-binding domain-containing protein [Acidimicrobiia bacterium]
MSKRHLLKSFALFLALGLTAAACATDSSEDATAETNEATDGCVAGNINISGSSTVEPISRRAAELFEPICPDAVITVNGPGTGDGFALFCDGETDISDASRPITDTEAETCAANGVEYTELKVAFDGIAVMTNPANEAVSCLSFVDLYALLGGESEGFANWSDANDLAAALGSDVAPYPDAELVISAPGTESGTYDSFIEIVLEGVAEESQGEEHQAIRQDFAGNANDNIIIEGIAGADTSLGWVGFAFAEENQDRVKEIAIAEEPGGDCIEPTIETIADGSYPVSRSLYIYVNNAKASENPVIVGYVDHYLGEAYTESVTEAFGDSGYVELPVDQLDATKAAWEAVRG